MKEKQKNSLSVKNNGVTKKVNKRWVIKITLWAFTLSIILSIISSAALADVDLYVAVLVLLAFIFVGIIFDVVGMAVASADEKPFHSMAAKKVKGAKEAFKLIRNAEKVSSFCNDVIGDIAGIISGATVGVVVVFFNGMFKGGDFIPTLLITGLVSAMTIGGKAIGKTFAINYSNTIVYMVGYFFSFFKIFKGEK